MGAVGEQQGEAWLGRLVKYFPEDPGGLSCQLLGPESHLPV